MRKNVQLGLFIVILVALCTVLVYSTLTSKIPGANDYYQRWYGARAFWVEGRNPYSPEIAGEVEMFLYKERYRPTPKDEMFPGDFLYPFPMALVLAPLTPLPYAWASAIWMVLTATGISFAFVAMANLYQWRLKFSVLILGIVWALTFYPASRGIFLGQPGTLNVCLHVLTLWALCRRRDVLAGILLGLTLFKPQLGFLILPALMLWALFERRWKFLLSFILTVAVQLALSFLLVPTWLQDWLQQTASYTGYTSIGAPAWVITHSYLPFLGTTGELVISGLLVIVLLWAWWQVLIGKQRQWFVWTYALTLAISHFIAIRTATPHFVAYFPALVFIFRDIARRYTITMALVLMAVLNSVLWVVFLTTLVGRYEHPINYLIVPIASLLVLWWWRPRWQHNCTALQLSTSMVVSSTIVEE